MGRQLREERKERREKEWTMQIDVEERKVLCIIYVKERKKEMKLPRNHRVRST
jgi:hypothetical protein